jgi:O-antigen/teichoic acid export membrane protein
MSQDYKNAAVYIPFLYLGSVFQSFSSFYGVGYLRDKKTKQASMTSIYGAAVNIIINVLLIHWIGLHAASLSTFVGFFAMWIMRERQNRETLGIRLDWIHFLCYCVPTILLCVLMSICGTVIDLAAVLIGLAAFVFFNREQMKELVIKIKKR